jgi:uncharacterized protein
MRTSSWSALALSAVIAVTAGAQANPAPAPPPARADSFTPIPGVDSAKVVAIRRLLDVMGARASMAAVMQTRMDMLKRQMPDVPAEFWTQLMAEAKGEELINLVIPIYDQHYSIEEIKALTTFFESPTGRKFVAEQPAMLRESMAVGAAWGREAGARIMKKLEDAGYKPPTG